MSYKVIDNMSGETKREFDDVAPAVEFARAMGPGPFGVRAYVVDSGRATVWPLVRWVNRLPGENPAEQEARLRRWFDVLV